MAISTELLREHIRLNDEKHDAAHRRLRADLTEGLNDVNGNLAAIVKARNDDHDELLWYRGDRDRRKELSGYRLVILAAAIGAFPHLIEVLLKAVGK